MSFPGKEYLEFLWKVKVNREGELNGLYISSLKREKLASDSLIPKAALAFQQ